MTIRPAQIIQAPADRLAYLKLLLDERDRRAARAAEAGAVEAAEQLLASRPGPAADAPQPACPAATTAGQPCRGTPRPGKAWCPVHAGPAWSDRLAALATRRKAAITAAEKALNTPAEADALQAAAGASRAWQAHRASEW